MFKATLAALSTLVTSTIAFAAPYPMHPAYTCEGEQGQRVVLNMQNANQLIILQAQEKPLTLDKTQEPAQNPGFELFTGLGGCNQQVKPGFANCFAIIRYSAELSPEIQRGEISGSAVVLGEVYTCRLNMM